MSDSTFNATGLTVFAILIYGMLAVFLEGVTFNLTITLILLFAIFFIEIIAYLVGAYL